VVASRQGSEPTARSGAERPEAGRSHGDLVDGLPNSYGYINPGFYEVKVAARCDTSGIGAKEVSCDWTIERADGAIVVRADGSELKVCLPEGQYSVNATVRLGDGRIGEAHQSIWVKDILVVVFGDSLATGEGNPEKHAVWDGAGPSPARLGRQDPPMPALWADGGPQGREPRVTPAGILPPANALHGRAHRSTRSGPAQFATRLEAEDPHTSVTFICLAATGARIDDLFVCDRPGRSRALGPGPALPAQLDEFHAIEGSRPADVVVLAVGLNDTRAFELLEELLSREIRFLQPLRLLAAYPTRKDLAAAKAPELETLVDPAELPALNRLGSDERRVAIAKDADQIYDLAAMAEDGLATARTQVERLGLALALDPLLSVGDVYVLEYPDVMGDDNGASAAVMLNELIPGARVNRREGDLARERLVLPLNRLLRAAADRHGWTYVEGIWASFRRHGYAAKDSWIVKAKESEQIQGPRLSLVGYLRGEFTPGMLHPNQRGHQVIADRLFQSITGKRGFPNRQAVGSLHRHVQTQ
jgi:hypothetical protein